MKDERFSNIFKDPAFQVDEESEEYRLLNPVVSKLGKKKKSLIRDQFEEVEEDESDESSDDDREWAEEVKKQYRLKVYNGKKLENH